MATEKTQHILGAADSAHQGIELARSLLEESLGNMGEILTQGCANLGLASLGCTMCLGQKLKEAAFILGDLRGDAHGLCVLLGKDLGVCEDEVTVLQLGPERPSARPEYRGQMFGGEADEPTDYQGGKKGFLMRYFPQDDEEFPPGEDEYDADEKPF